MRLGSVLEGLPGSPPVLVCPGPTGDSGPLTALPDDLITDRRLDGASDAIEHLGPDESVAIRGDTVVASSPWEGFSDSVLGANQAIFAGSPDSFTRGDLPEVGRALEDTTFVQVSTDDEADSGLLTALSRFIETIALESGSGTLRTGFQKLSRVRDERGTRQVYRRIGESDVETHIYGVPDWFPPSDRGLTIHAGYTENFREHWFVAYDPPADAAADGVALLARSLESGGWHGAFSRDERFVSSLVGFLETEM